MTTLYVAPSGAFGPSGQCRIYASDAGGRYEAHPQSWREVGLMNSEGGIRCIEAEFSVLQDDVPLMAGSYYPV